MKPTIFHALKDSFLSDPSQNNRPIIELCLTELSSGNFSKAIDLSEELIKKDNNAVGWAAKALSQANLFDYNNNLFFLKSSLSSLEEFKNKTNLRREEIITVEAIFITTFLAKTNSLVLERLEEVIELRRKALAEKEKAKGAALATAMSGYAGVKSKTDVGKILGYGGAMIGVAANATFNSNSKLLNEASKGVFGVAVANIAMSIDSAKNLKKVLNDLNNDLRLEAIATLKEWINTLAFYIVKLLRICLYTVKK